MSRQYSAFDSRSGSPAGVCRAVVGAPAASTRAATTAHSQERMTTA
jgi:hypothetical protein